MKKKIKFTLAGIVVLLFVTSIVLGVFKSEDEDRSNHGEGAPVKGMSVLQHTWAGYKSNFIERSGRVDRRDQNDTVSEGQAYAMLRAVWAGDKEVFDRCYGWTEENLSRKNTQGDNLLAWHWKDGAVIDWMPASDADLDYALSLIFASFLWGETAPAGFEGYQKKALKILSDILQKETYLIQDRLYLSPWILDKAAQQEFKPVNPSYYSPAHFRIFYKMTNDERWMKLVDTTYFMMDALSKNFNGVSGVGLIPDWCSVDGQNQFHLLEGKSAIFGWDAIRVPIRLGFDYFWFGSKEAERFFSSGFSAFLDKEWKKNNAIFCEYSYSGTCDNEYENPLFYAAYYYALKATRSAYAERVLKRTRDFLIEDGEEWVYENKQAYYANSLAWMAEGLHAGQIRNIEEGSS